MWLIYIIAELLFLKVFTLGVVIFHAINYNLFNMLNK